MTKAVGCYHWKYYLGGELIGVGVVDMLPHGLSSVYFFYEPSYKEYRLGVFSSLIEIEYVRWLGLTFPEFKHYYMGFYIPSSHKMSYKGTYSKTQPTMDRANCYAPPPTAGWTSTRTPSRSSK